MINFPTLSRKGEETSQSLKSRLINKFLRSLRNLLKAALLTAVIGTFTYSSTIPTRSFPTSGATVQTIDLEDSSMEEGYEAHHSSMADHSSLEEGSNTEDSSMEERSDTEESSVQLRAQGVTQFPSPGGAEALFGSRYESGDSVVSPRSWHGGKASKESFTR
uniref:Uncharacterized protein n=1 Tax=Corydalis conspersa TaxID=2182691 RepID=A0A6G8J373_9MAGN|nr:hypothetical protein [Corydalis conspersa]QIM61601.1 hypothetical protein [Corydalis conspersa]